jgi:hypothetical protein
MQSANGTVQSRKSVAAIILTYSFWQRSIFNLLPVFISKWNVAWFGQADTDQLLPLLAAL